MEIGKSYYFITHAYFHYVGTITEIIGTNRIKVTNLVAVHRCQRGWTAFFAEGFKQDTTFDVLPDGGLNVVNFFDWNHPIPRNK